MRDADDLPEDLTPLNLLAYFYNALGMCGCSETDEMVKSLIRLMEWIEGDKEARYDTLYPETGVFYLLVAQLDTLGLTEHGTSIRFPWLTDDGKRLLGALKGTDGDTIKHAKGVAYDGLEYGWGL